MRLPLAIALLIPILAGCSNESVTGIWKGTIQVEDKERRIQRQANRIGNPVLELKGDQTFSLSAGVQITGVWQELEGGELEFEIKSINKEPVAEFAAALGLSVEKPVIEGRVSADRRKIYIDSIPRVPAKVEFMR